jgi:hypothetical protein
VIAIDLGWDLGAPIFERVCYSHDDSHSIVYWTRDLNPVTGGVCDVSISVQLGCIESYNHGMPVLDCEFLIDDCFGQIEHWNCLTSFHQSRGSNPRRQLQHHLVPEEAPLRSRMNGLMCQPWRAKTPGSCFDVAMTGTTCWKNLKWELTGVPTRTQGSMKNRDVTHVFSVLRWLYSTPLRNTRLPLQYGLYCLYWLPLGVLPVHTWPNSSYVFRQQRSCTIEISIRLVLANSESVIWFGFVFTEIVLISSFDWPKTSVQIRFSVVSLVFWIWVSFVIWPPDSAHNIAWSLWFGDALLSSLQRWLSR